MKNQSLDAHLASTTIATNNDLRLLRILFWSFFALGVGSWILFKDYLYTNVSIGFLLDRKQNPSDPEFFKTQYASYFLSLFFFHFLHGKSFQYSIYKSTGQQSFSPFE